MKFNINITSEGITKTLEINSKTYIETWEMDNPGRMSCLTETIADQLYDDGLEELANAIEDTDEMDILRYFMKGEGKFE